MGKHTPGVWRYTACDETAIDNVSTVSTGECYIATDMNEADGLLIAAAPDLLACCEELFGWLDPIKVRGTDGFEMVARIEAALKKARGGQK